jgi:hypothetical protein
MSADQAASTGPGDAELDELMRALRGCRVLTEQRVVNGECRTARNFEASVASGRVKRLYELGERARGEA